jgi:hypothetical protein
MWKPPIGQNPIKAGFCARHSAPCMLVSDTFLADFEEYGLHSKKNAPVLIAGRGSFNDKQELGVNYFNLSRFPSLSIL